MNTIIGAPTNGQDVWLQTHLRRKGHYLLLDGWLVIGTRVKLFTLKVDLRPIIKYVVRTQLALRGKKAIVSGCIGCSVGEAGLELRYPKGRFKLGTRVRRAINAIAKKKLANKAKRYVKKSATEAIVIGGIKLGGSVEFTGGVSLSAVPVPSNATASSKKASDKLNDAGHTRRRRANMVHSKLGRYMSRSRAKARSMLIARARAKGMIEKKGPAKVNSAVNKTVDRLVRNKLRRIAVKTKSPKVKEEAASLIRSTGKRKKSVRAAMKRVIKQTPNSPRARKAAAILQTVAAHHTRSAAISKGKGQQGVTGMVVNNLGQITPGRYTQLNTGVDTPDILYSRRDIKQGHFQRVGGLPVGPIAGDCIGCDSVGEELPIGPVAVEGCIGCGDIL